MRRDHIPAVDRYMQLLDMSETLDGDEAIAAFLLAKRLMAKSGVTIRALVQPVDNWPLANDASTAQRFIKILQLTDSDKEGESIAAFLMTMNMMKRHDISFRDILLPPESTEGTKETGYYPSIELEMISLRNRVWRLSKQVAEQDQEIKRYRTAFDELMDTSWSLHHGTKADHRADHAPLLN